MEDVFDKIEKVYKDGYVFLVIGKGNKRKSLTKPSSYYFSYIDYKNESLVWKKGLDNGACLIPGDSVYNQVKKIARENMVRCLFVILSEEEYYYLTLTQEDYYQTNKPVKKETWWDLIKVWFSRKVTEFITLPVDSSLPGED